jgi:hypothetical protein
MIRKHQFIIFLAFLLTLSGIAPAYANNFSGSGDAIVDTKITSNSVLVNVEHVGNSNFIVWAKNTKADNIDLVANEIGSHSGVHMLQLSKRERLRYFEITADGSWNINIKPLKTAKKWKGSSISGSGNQVIKTPKKIKSNSKLQMHYEGDGNFIIWSFSSNGSRQRLLANEIGSYSGTKFFGRNAVYLEIVSDGNWTLTFK